MARTSISRRKTVLVDGARRIVDRNPNGTGSVYWDEPKQRWRATFYDPTTRTKRSVLGTTKTEAEQRRKERLAELTRRSPAGVLGDDPTVRQLVDWFLDEVADVRPNTLYSYRAQCRHISDEIGAVRVREVSVEHLRLFLNELRRKTDDREALSDHTATNIRARLRQVLDEAVTLGYLNENPVTKIKAARTGGTGKKKSKTVLSADQCKALVIACAQHHLGAAVAMLFTMGNRSSEVLGLAWSDIDLDAGVATVRRGSTYSGKGIGQRLGPTKTSGTQGVHQLPPSVITMLRAHKERQDIERKIAGLAWRREPYDGEELDMVFTDHHGRLIYSHRLHRAVRDCCEKAGIPTDGVGTHTGRRSVITALYGAGLDLSDVAEHVGHSQLATTAGYVQHLSQRPQKTAAVAAHLLDPAAEGQKVAPGG